MAGTAGLREAVKILNSVVDDGDASAEELPYFHATNVLIATIAAREGVAAEQVIEELRQERALVRAG